MNDRISTKDYRKQIIDPALQAQFADVAFQNNVLAPKKTFKQLGESEHAIQKLILERLGLLRGAFFWRENSGMVKETDRYGKMRMWRAGIKGIADIVGVYKGRLVAIEVKAKGKKLSMHQKAFLQRVRDCGGIGFVCDDDKQVIKLLEGNYEK